ncbi:MAG: RHS repeat-associated core domain-containing protein [Chloroflexota bacterium]
MAVTVTPTVMPTVTVTPTVTATPAPTPVVTVDPPVIVAAASALTLTWEGPSSLALSVQPAAVNPGETFTLQVSVVRVEGEDKPLASGTLTIAQDGVAALSIDGGEVSGLNGRVKVRFPQNAYAPAGKSNGEAAPQGMDVRIRPLGAAYAEAERLNGYEEALPPYTLSGNAFEISAWGQEDAASVHQFTQPITIEVHYDESQVQGEESTLRLFYYDTQWETWIELPGWTDTDANVIYAHSDHLTVMDFNTQNWEASRLPNLKDFQVSSFTGAGTYSFPIEVPSGQGGLQPALSLSYNSQTVDNASALTQASWVGMGWSFDTGYVQRNQNGTPNNLLDDSFTLNFNGTSSTVVKGTDGKYHATDENFLRIEYVVTGNPNGGYDEVSYWLVWGKDGTKYYFGENGAADYPNRANYMAFDTCTNGSPVNLRKVAWRWALNRVVNVHGQSLTYRNQNQSRSITSICDESAIHYTDQAGYPVDITYPNNRYRIAFVRQEDRNDWDHAWFYDSPAAQNFFERARLTQIQVQHDADGDGTFTDDPLVRKYVLQYAHDLGSTPIFSNLVWSRGLSDPQNPQGGKTLTLMRIVEYGYNNAAPLPATNFTYGDNMHLTQGSNGYGGSVTYTYSAWYETTTTDSNAFIHHFGAAGNPCYNGSTDVGGWTGINGGGAGCDGGDMGVSGTAVKGMAANMIRPGSYYLLSATMKEYVSTDSARISMSNGYSDQDLPLLNFNNLGIWQTTSGYLQLPASAAKTANWKIKTYTHARVSWFIARPVVTRYRVTNKAVYDAVTGQTTNYVYRYDEPATNDNDHSANALNVSEYAQYSKEYSEFRGHGMVEEAVPGIAGLVNTTFFYQDDDRKGSPAISMLRTAENADAFGSVNSSLWAWSGISPAVAYLRGDAALKLPGGASYGQFYRSASSITDGEMAMVQFYVSGSDSTQAVLALQNPSNANQRWAIHVNGNQLYAQYNNGSSGWKNPASMTFTRDQWYVLLLIADSDGFFTQVWKRNDPTAMMTYECSAAACGMPAGITWRFQTWTANGTLYLDEYSEGKLQTLSQSLYTTSTNTPVTPEPITIPSGGQYGDIQIKWTRLTQQTNMTFNGDAQWVGTQNTYSYDGYGNQSRVVEAEWRNNAWYNYRATDTGYHTGAVSGVYLVGLPSYSNYFQCPGGACGYTAAQIIGQELYLYDGSNAHTTSPSTGKLTGQRTLLSCISGNCTPTANLRYSDVRYGYDSYGNQTTFTMYTGEGAYGGTPQGTAQTTTTCYESFNWDTGVCTNDGYHTYPQGVTDAVGLKSQVTYNKALGVPTAEKNANGQVTNATYDSYGRILTIQRPAEESGYTTIQVTYPAASDTFGFNDPFYTEAKQHIEGSTYFTIRKYYSGLGQLLQTQVVGAVVNGSSADILTDTYYNINGTVSKQSMPYTVSTGGFYHVRDTAKPATVMTYDLFGRPSRTTSPDGSYTETIYGDGYANNAGYLLTTVRDPEGNSSATRTDMFGRTIFADAPPISPDVTYSYYPNDLLYQVTRGGATTTLLYDIGGRKTQMADPDMGTWNYTYDALGNLKTQTDARGCVTTLSYDNLNRLTGKAYGASNCGSGNTNVTYGYDAYNTTIGQYGRGHRTSMSDGSGSTAWTYNTRGLVSAEAKTISGVTYNTSWTYNSADLPETMTYPDDEVLTYRYLPQMLLDDLMSDHNPSNAITNYFFVSDTKYDAAGRTTLRWLGGTSQAANPTLVNSFHYNNWDVQGGRMDYIKAGTYTSQASLFDQRYTYDNNGNITSILDVVNSNQKQCYGYDALNRLTSAAVGINDSTCSGSVGNGEYANEGYGYDTATGNLLTKTGMGTYTYPLASAARPHAVTSTTAGWAYQYDANGNMTRRDPPGADYYDFVYDAENRVYQVKKNGAVITTFTYDGDGNRVKSVEGSTTTVFVGTHYEVSGSTVTKYYTAGGTKIAMRKAGTTFQWLLGDHLGSTSVAYRHSDGQTTRQLYKPWGESRYTSGTLPTKYTYTGQYSYATSVASDFGLHYYNARWYDSQLGRFAQADTLVPNPAYSVDWDRYAYVRNNPINHTDSTGHWPDWLDYAVGAGSQFLDDMTAGLYSDIIYAATGFDFDLDGSEAFQNGRKFGRSVSTAVSVTETGVGTATAVTAVASIGPTAGGGIAAAAPSGGTSLVVAGVAIPVEVIIAVAGTAAAVHGGYTVKYIKSNPLSRSSNSSKRLTPNQMNQAILRGKAPAGVKQVHMPKVPGEQLHVHFTDGSALNIDGTWKHGGLELSNSQMEWLKQNGWKLPSSE